MHVPWPNLRDLVDDISRSNPVQVGVCEKLGAVKEIDRFTMEDIGSISLRSIWQFALGPVRRRR